MNIWPKEFTLRERVPKFLSNEFYIMARDVLGSPLWNLLYVTILTLTLKYLS